MDSSPTGLHSAYRSQGPWQAKRLRLRRMEPRNTRKNDLSQKETKGPEINRGLRRIERIGIFVAPQGSASIRVIRGQNTARHNPRHQASVLLRFIPWPPPFRNSGFGYLVCFAVQQSATAKAGGLHLHHSSTARPPNSRGKSPIFRQWIPVSSVSYRIVSFTMTSARFSPRIRI